jgi:hypothetical protein
MIKRLVSTIALLLAAACSDQGAVKPEAQKQEAQAQSGRAAAPALQSPRAESTDALPTGHPPITPSAMSSLPVVPEGAGTGDSALAWVAPSSWISEKPSSSMRRAQYKVPGPDGDGDGECVVFYFGPGQGGDPMANAERWAGQFTLPGGGTAEKNLKTSDIEVGGLKVFMVEVAGTYSGGMTMSMEPSKPMTGYRLLGAIAPGPDANWYFKFTGPDATVNAQRAAFETMVKSLKHGQTP